MVYRTIFLAADWQHVRYLGWRDSWPDRALRRMTQRCGPLRRSLLVSEIAEVDRLRSVWRPERGAVSHLCETRFHDLTGSADVRVWLESEGFVELPASERMLSIATSVIDLSRDPDTILAAMASSVRRDIKAAEKAGCLVDEDAGASSVMVDRFFDAFDAMARERGLQRLNADMFRAMLADRRARLFAAAKTDGPASFLVSYEAGDTALYLLGASEAKQNDGGGRLIHWRAIQAFREAGLRWYDLGGLPSAAVVNGIYRFKQGFGGALVDLGIEYGRSGAFVRAARAVQHLRQARD